MMKRLLIASMCMVGVLCGIEQAPQLTPKLEKLVLEEIDNQSDGFFKIYQVGKMEEYVIFPNSKLSSEVELTAKKLTVYPISGGGLQSIFIERGYDASGSCKASKGPYLISYWYGYPTQQTANRVYENFCMHEKKHPKIGLRIYKDGSASLYAIEGLDPVVNH